MTASEARELLDSAAEGEEPVFLEPAVLGDLTVEDLPDGVAIEIGESKEGTTYIAWEGHLVREGGKILGQANYVWTRKYWYAPLGLEHYLDLVRRAVEVRARTHHDVTPVNFEDDGAFIHLSFKVTTAEKNLKAAYARVRKICDELAETAEAASAEIGRNIASVAARVSGWGGQSFDALVDAVENAALTDDKGRSLEELASRLFETVQGLKVTGRIRTATEEIDLSILNDSTDPRLRREAAIVLAECKNWTGKCGKDEFVIFREKLENRNRRASLGFLISWNGFAGTVTKEMLRGSREETMIVPVTGKDIRAAVRGGNFAEVLFQCWDAAVHL